MSTHFTVDRGELVEPRHLTPVVSNPWPTERDEDVYERRSNPVTVALWCSLMSIFIGVVAWAAW
ncbi:hypothetical protein HQO24_10295 [Rhodococcus fascians]|nr:hypothetical protein [Rhodococcus fascians]MBY4396930.1 hypothetical protein [Rhodococcus fascians]MBY4407409.1 hypothetical protein [Rhodococcus fascians]MBY4421462.1 hypothetical protein [Rhodococcus fascians]MBY4460785.1 hypothetical protein [Rhodococcus fascians]